MEDKNIRVTVVEQRGSGGMIHYAYQLCTALANEGAEVKLITAHEYELERFPHNFKTVKLLDLWSLKGDPLLKRIPRHPLESLWIKVFWQIRRSFRALKFLKGWILLARHLVATRPDVVQFGETQFQFEAFFFAYLKKKGLILSQICHEFENREAGKNFWIQISDRLFGPVFSNFSYLFFHGESNKKRFLELFHISEERLFTIRHGNENIFPRPSNEKELETMLRDKYNLQSTHRVVTFFGNITPSKGLPDLIKAFDIISEYDRQARLIVAGMPAKQMDMSSIRHMVTELRLEDHVVFDSRYLDMAEVGPLMNISDVIVYPYRNITQSGALQVAYNFGKPVVATNIGGFPEAVDEGKSGFLVPPESPSEFARAVLMILENPDLAKKMGDYAKHLSETRFAWGPIAQKILAIYRNFPHA